MGDSAGSTVVVGGGALTADLFEVLTRASFSTAFEVDAVIGSIFCYSLSPSEQNFPVMESPLPYGCPVRSHSTEQSGSLSISSQDTRQGCSGGQQGTADRIDSNASPRCGDDIHDKSAKAVVRSERSERVLKRLKPRSSRSLESIPGRPTPILCRPAVYTPTRASKAS